MNTYQADEIKKIWIFDRVETIPIFIGYKDIRFSVLPKRNKNLITRKGNLRAQVPVTVRNVCTGSKSNPECRSVLFMPLGRNNNNTKQCKHENVG